MPDVDEQLRSYAAWLAEVADAEAARRTDGATIVASGARGSRAGRLIGAAAAPATSVAPTTTSSIADELVDPAVEGFTVAVAGRTFVLLPESSDTAIERPYLSFPDTDDDEFAVVGSGGCTRLIGRGGWADASGGLVSLDGSLAVGTQGCSPGDDVIPFSASTRLRMSATSPDVLDIVDTSGSRNLVDVDTLPHATLDQLEGRWSAGTDDQLIIDPQQSLMIRHHGRRPCADRRGHRRTRRGGGIPRCDTQHRRSLRGRSRNVGTRPKHAGRTRRHRGWLRQRGLLLLKHNAPTNSSSAEGQENRSEHRLVQLLRSALNRHSDRYDGHRRRPPSGDRVIERLQGQNAPEYVPISRTLAVARGERSVRPRRGMALP